MLVGIIRPAILLPPGLLEEGHRESLRLLRLALTHELAHVRRKDLFWNLAQAFVETLFFFHPLVWVARRQTRYLQELACDGMTLESTQATPADYGRAILGIIERQRMEPARLAGVGVAGVNEHFKETVGCHDGIASNNGSGHDFGGCDGVAVGDCGDSVVEIDRAERAGGRAGASTSCASGRAGGRDVDGEGGGCGGEGD